MHIYAYFLLDLQAVAVQRQTGASGGGHMRVCQKGESGTGMRILQRALSLLERALIILERALYILKSGKSPTYSETGSLHLFPGTRAVPVLFGASAVIMFGLKSS